jgi:hypothetical protein
MDGRTRRDKEGVSSAAFGARGQTGSEIRDPKSGIRVPGSGRVLLVDRPALVGRASGNRTGAAPPPGGLLDVGSLGSDPVHSDLADSDPWVPPPAPS